MRKTLFALFALLGAAGPTLAAQDRRNEQFYYPGSFNWKFLSNYPEAARLFNAFDYGHAILYETLYTRPDSARAASGLARAYQYLTTDLLVRPPRYAVAEEVIEPTYAKLAWKAMRMFDWAHVLHRQLYDVYADERIPMARKDSLIENLTDYYLKNREFAFAPVPKSMTLMDDQYYSQVFRKRFPTFNGLIWSYHWLQVGLYEPFIAGQTFDQQKAGVQAAVARFWDMLKGPPQNMPRVMPLTATVAPLFTERHPRAAAIFDNLHMMHDIISDILAADTVPRDGKRNVIYAVLGEFRDTTRNVMTRDEWLMMGHHMGGIEAMGGPVLGHEGMEADTARVREVVEAVARFTQSKNIAGLDTLFAADDWVRVIEGAGVNNGWVDYRDHHLRPELEEMGTFTYRFFDVEPHVNGDVAWAAFRYELTLHEAQGHTAIEGRGTAVLERRGNRWQVVQLHTSGRRKQPGQ